MRKFYDLAGLGADEKNLYHEIGNDYRDMVSPVPSVYNRIDKETVFIVGGRPATNFGSEHSPDHVTLYNERSDPVENMLLPRITPIIAVWWQEPDGNPLKFLKFLHGLNIPSKETLILPAHDKSLQRLSTRITDLIQHHQNRLEITFNACNEPVTGSIMKKLFKRFRCFQIRFAMGETIAI